MAEEKVLEFPTTTGAQVSVTEEEPPQLQVIGVEPRFHPVHTPMSMDDVVNLIAAGWMYWGTLPIIPPMRDQLSGAPSTPIMSHVFYRPVFGPTN